MDLGNFILLCGACVVAALAGFVVGVRYCARNCRQEVDQLCRLFEEHDRLTQAWVRREWLHRHAPRSEPQS